jgi:hypothetical protein
MAAPASAFFWKPKFWYYKHHYVKKTPPSTSNRGAGPYIVGCIMGSALGLITAALAKKTGELTIDEAHAIAFTCGLGFFPVVANFKQPAPVVKAKF